MNKFTGLPNVKHGATLHLILRLLHRPTTRTRSFTSTVTALHHRIGCYGIYRGVSSDSIYSVYSRPSHSGDVIYIIRAIHSIVTIRGASLCQNLCRILNKIVSPVSNVNPSSLRVSDLIRHIHSNRIGRIVFTLDPAVRKSAAGFCVCHGLRTANIGVSTLSHNVSINSRLRCTSRTALKHSLIGHVPFAKGDC